MLKRSKIFILCMAVLFTLLFNGCGKSNENTNSVTSPGTASKNTDSVNTSQSQDQAEFKLPLVDKPVTLTIACKDNAYAPASYTSGLPVWNEIEKRTGIKIKWDVQPGPQYTTSIQARLAAGSDLPDICTLPGTNPTPYGQSGTVISLNELISKYAPNLQQVFNDKPMAKNLMTSGDGNLYGLAPIIEGGSAGEPFAFVMRQDWLDKLGLKAPESIDDWYTVLKAFKEKDPNGNKKADEIGYGTNPVEAFAGAFGLKLVFSNAYSQGFDAGADNKVYYQFTEPRLKDLLTYCHKLYAEGLFDPDYWNPNAEGIEAKVTKDRVGSMQMWAGVAINWQKVLQGAGVKNARFVMVAPPSGPNGKGMLEAYGLVAPAFTAITKDCKNPEAAIKWLDYVYASKEGQTLLAWGVEGKTYSMADGKPKFTDFVVKNPDGLGSTNALRSQGSWPTICWIQDLETYKQVLSSNPDFADAGERMKPYFVQPFPFLLGTKAEDDQIIPIMNDITTYKDEMLAKFVMGQEPLENFDKYVQKIKSMGIDEVVKVRQAQYDKLLKK